MRKTPLLLAGLLAATALPAAVAALPPAAAWEIGPWVRGRNYSVGMPAQPDPAPGGGLTFEFPRGGGEIDALTTAVGPLAGARAITFRYRIDAPGARASCPRKLPGRPPRCRCTCSSAATTGALAAATDPIVGIRRATRSFRSPRACAQ